MLPFTPLVHKTFTFAKRSRQSTYERKYGVVTRTLSNVAWLRYQTETKCQTARFKEKVEKRVFNNFKIESF
jgi:hypothetical protein